MTTETLTEAEKMRLVPCIDFVDGPSGRRAHIAGTGPDVWQMIDTYRSCDYERETVAEIFDYLTLEQVQAAFTYYELYPDEIDARLAMKDAITPEVIRAKYPWPPGYCRTGTK